MRYVTELGHPAVNAEPGANNVDTTSGLVLLNLEGFMDLAS
jgi:hypothetical protein